MLKYKTPLYLSLRVTAGYRTDSDGLIFAAKCLTIHLFLSKEKVG
jgi:hypothetical protein